MAGGGRRPGRGGRPLHPAIIARTRRGTVGSANATGTTTLELQWSGVAATPTISTSWDGNDDQAWQLDLTWSCLAEVDAVEDTTAVGPATIMRNSVTMPTPTLVNGRPDSTWVPSIASSIWATNLQLIVGGIDVSRLRGKMFIPLDDAHTEPFGDAEASFALPGLTEFDDPATFGLTALAPVKLRRKDNSGVFHTLYEGELASLQPDTGQGVVIACVGTLYRLDLLKQSPALLTTAADYGQVIASTFNSKRARYNLNIGHMATVTTGITGTRSASFSEFLTGAVQDYLAEMTTDTGGQWTIRCLNRTPVLALKDTTTVHATISYGATRGVNVSLSKDFTTATTGVYGSGTNGHCSWMGARFPNLVGGSTPAFPLAVGHTFVAGDGQTGFAEFAAFLRRGQYGTIVSDDTYLSADVDNVEQFQRRAGITVDGIVGAQTWEAAFQPGFNQGSIKGAYVDTIYEKTETVKRLYNAQGADVGPNPAFDATVPRIEEYVPFGDNVSKNLGRKSAKQIIARNYPAGRVGTVELSVDPVEMCRYDLAAGMNLKLENYEGSHVLLHITRRERDWVNGKVILTVDEKARDLLTVASIHQRNKDVSDLTRRQKFGRTRAKVFNDYGAWLCEDGAGEIPLMNQQAGFWNTQRIAAAPKGSIERISLAFGSGLTEHLLNRNLSSNPPASIPGAARGCYVITTQPITPNQLANLPGLDTPLTDMADGTNPWDYNEDILTNVFGKVIAAGGPGQALGFYPNNDPGDGTSTNLTGRYEDGGSIDFGPTGRYWLWVSIWTPVSCKVGGRIFPGAPA